MATTNHGKLVRKYMDTHARALIVPYTTYRFWVRIGRARVESPVRCSLFGRKFSTETFHRRNWRYDKKRRRDVEFRQAVVMLIEVNPYA